MLHRTALRARPSLLALALLALALAATAGCGLSAADVRRISASELHAAQAAGQALIVDVRSAEAFDALHIRGAISVPLEEVGARAGELPREKLVATYCT
jgi:3-mercaptopyruvate sulfurtransferase SseA